MSYDTKLEKYNKFIPALYKPGVNPLVTALLKAWAESDSEIEVQISEAAKELFTVSANGKFLDALGANVGVERPRSINLSDDDYRKLIPTLSYAPKQIRKTMYDILDTFWGPLYSRTNLTSIAYEPYNLGSINTISGTSVFQNGAYRVSGIGTNYLTQVKQGDYIKYSGHDNSYFVKVSKIVSDTELDLSETYKGGTSGVGISGIAHIYTSRYLDIIIDGGDTTKRYFIPPNFLEDPSQATAQQIADAINFQSDTSNSTIEKITASIIEDNVTKNVYINIRTQTPGSKGSLFVKNGTANKFSYGSLNFTSNYAYIPNDKASLFSPSMLINVGSEVSGNYIQTSIISITSDIPSAGTTQIQVADDISAFNLNDLNYIFTVGDIGFLENEILISKNKQSTLIYEINSGELIIRIPATVPTLRRELAGSMHMRDWSGSITSFDNINKTITVDLDGEVSLNGYQGKKLETDLYSFNILGNTPGTSGVILTVSPVDPLGDLSGLSTMPGKNGFIITDDIYQGSFIFNPSQATYTVASNKCILNQIINSGSIEPSISVSGADDLPNKTGYLIFNFGSGTEEQPVRYRGRPNNNTLLLDPSYVFKNNHQVGEMIRLLGDSLSGTIPRLDGGDLSTYITDVSAAVDVVKDFITQCKAAGIRLSWIIDGPEYLYNSSIPPIDSGSSNIVNYRYRTGF